MERSEDLYKILEIDHNATQEQIKKAYRKLSMVYHPDRNKNNPEATSKFQKIGSTYEILGDEAQRKLYDMKNLHGSMFDSKSAVELGKRLAAEGADILDVGGESTRPGAQPVTVDEEMRRVLPVIEQLKAEIQVPISLDTRKSEVAQAGLDLGVEIINDVTGLRGDSRMKDVVARAHAGVVIMHMQGTPQTMQLNPTYEDLLGELEDFFSTQMQMGNEAGIMPEQVVIDPGIGFGKTLAHNLEILTNLARLRSAAGRPVLVGVSRKSFIGKILDLPVEERLEGSAAAVAAAVLNGADIVRVHDVKAMRRVVRMVDALANRGNLATQENG